MKSSSSTLSLKVKHLHPSKESEVVDWYDWETSTFALAQAENKPILLDLTAV